MKLVTVLDAFAGRVVMTEEKWKEVEANKNLKRKKEAENWDMEMQKEHPQETGNKKDKKDDATKQHGHKKGTVN